MVCNAHNLNLRAFSHLHGYIIYKIPKKFTPGYKIRLTVYLHQDTNPAIVKVRTYPSFSSDLFFTRTNPFVTPRTALKHYSTPSVSMSNLQIWFVGEELDCLVQNTAISLFNQCVYSLLVIILFVFVCARSLGHESLSLL